MLNPTETVLYWTELRRVRAMDLRTQVVSTVVGNTAATTVDGVGTAATLHLPWGLAMTSNGATLWTADYGANVVRSINVATRLITTVYGWGSAGATPSLDGEGGTPLGGTLPLAALSPWRH